jgi:energy-coupling factor transporter ATP-binding protein EcfA2
MSANNPSPAPKNWPTILLFLAAVGVPGAAAIKFADTISTHPLWAFAIGLLYELCLLPLAFLGKVWDLLVDAWSKDTATWVNNLVKKQWFSYRSYYARFLTFQHRDFDIKGLSTQSIYTLELEQVFVDLSIDPKPIHQVLSNPIPSEAPEELRSGQHSLWEYLSAKPLKNQHLVIVGAPGSGKTTLLKHLALTFVSQKKRRSLSRSLRHAYRLPFLLFLREHTKDIHTNQNFSLIDAIQNTLSRWDRSVPEGWVRRQLNKDTCLILLDGLDEVADVTRREEVVKWVQQQMQTYASNRFLVSSRPFGYRSNPLSGVMLLEVRPFTFEQIRRFVQNWYRANEIMSSQKDDPGVYMRARNDAQDLVRRIQQTPALSALAVNPLLLTMIATIHRYRSTLPGKRVELYAEICEVFLGKRQQARGLHVDLRPAQCVSVLQPLAYIMMTQNRRDIPARESQEAIKDALKLVSNQMAPKEFLQMVENMSGLLLEREQGIYTFAHLTFQEYLAATYIREQQLEATLIAQVGMSWWAETTRLYCAQTDATSVIEACLKLATPSITHLMLGLECHEEALKVRPTIKPQIDRILEQEAEDPDSQRRKVVAETLLARRLKEMMLIGEGMYRDTSLILNAEYQLFLDEQSAQGRYYQPDQWMDAQFPPGQALLPVLGVRPSAAQAFCDWLTERKQEGWRYHLPRPFESQSEQAHARPAWLPPCTWNVPHGYWQDEHGFSWIQQPIPLQKQAAPLDLDMRDSDNPIMIGVSAKTIEWEEFSNYLGLAHAHALSLAHNSIHTHAPSLAYNLSLARDSAHTHFRDLAIASGLAIAIAIDHTLTIASGLAIAIDRDLTRARDLAIDRARDFPYTSSIATSIARDLARTSIFIIELDRCEERQQTSGLLELAQLLALLSICMSFNAHKLDELLHNSSQTVWRSLFTCWKKRGKPPLDIQHALSQGIEIYDRLERLEKRRQGKEPACEGILIMKEQKEDEREYGTSNKSRV